MLARENQFSNFVIKELYRLKVDIEAEIFKIVKRIKNKTQLPFLRL